MLDKLCAKNFSMPAPGGHNSLAPDFSGHHTYLLSLPTLAVTVTP